MNLSFYFTKLPGLFFVITSTLFFLRQWACFSGFEFRFDTELRCFFSQKGISAFRFQTKNVSCHIEIWPTYSCPWLWRLIRFFSPVIHVEFYCFGFDFSGLSQNCSSKSFGWVNSSFWFTFSNSWFHPSSSKFHLKD